jgi:hypothetical protein
LAYPTINLDAAILDKAIEGEMRFKSMILTDKLWSCAQILYKASEKCRKKGDIGE